MVVGPPCVWSELRLEFGIRWGGILTNIVPSGLSSDWEILIPVAPWSGFSISLGRDLNISSQEFSISLGWFDLKFSPPEFSISDRVIEVRWKDTLL